MHFKGRRAEKVAESYLTERKYTIHFKNIRFGRYEIDLVCELEGIIVFVEVKSLSTSTIKNP
ncbi:MAG: YraN family protein, partial [Crocinitomicaceae bacterium]|nr:YraN family protein [Crocinitomicaceae bacterium]